jgi:hypothetical protein
MGQRSGHGSPPCTGLLAAMAFAQGDFAALAIAGTHRCANIDYGQADGRTRVCNEGSHQPYRESDMAHAAQSYFQAFHEAFTDTLPDGVAVQLHAFAQDDEDPLFIISDGTRVDAGMTHPSNRLYLALLETIAAADYAPEGASCNIAGHPDSLCATTNVQGRYTNGVVPRHVPRRSADAASGRFLHLELGTDLRFTDGELDGLPVIQALKRAL